MGGSLANFNLLSVTVAGLQEGAVQKVSRRHAQALSQALYLGEAQVAKAEIGWVAEILRDPFECKVGA